MNDQALSRARQAITVARNPAMEPHSSCLEAGEIIRQDVVAAPAKPPSALMLVIDGSARIKTARAAAIKALDAIPPDASVGMILAQEPALRLPIGPWSSAQKQAALRMLDAAPFVSGRDNAPSLSDMPWHMTSNHIRAGRLKQLDISQSEVGIDQAHVAGISTGGCVLQNLAIDHPERLRCCIFSNTWMKADEYIIRVQMTRKRIALSYGPEEYVKVSTLFTNGAMQFRDLDKMMELERRALGTVAPLHQIIKE